MLANADAPREVTEVGIVILVIFEQPLKIPVGKDVTVIGIVTSCMDVHPAKVDAPMLVKFVRLIMGCVSIIPGISPIARAPEGAIVDEPLKDSSAVHPSNAFAPIVVRLGARTVDSAVEFLKLLAPIVVTLGKNTSTSPVFIKASVPMLVRL